ncbi:MAG: hypothetical protein FJ014_05155 [Chloroflexi bacterium]|nr:hypothetical protein [Chloroflexota bacterium]
MDERPRTIKQHLGIVVILAAFFALGITYAVTTPLFEAPDELQHYARIKRVAEAIGLFELDPAVSQLAHQQRYQQPLYHLVGALVTFWDDAGDLPRLLWFNPHADIGVAKADGNVNLLIHTGKEGFPYRGTSLGVYALRLLSVLMGTGTVLFTYLIALEIFPQRQDLAFGAAAINAFIPQFLFISGVVNNDNLVTPLCSLALLMMVKISNIQYPISNRNRLLDIRYWILGLVLGLATLTKVNALGLLPLAVLVVAISSYRQRSVKLFISSTALVLGTVAVVSGWRFVRNWQLYGDPTALQMFLDTLAPRHPKPTLPQFMAEWGDYGHSFWGLFGLGNVPLGAPVYRILDTLALLGALGTLIFPVRAWRRRRVDDRAWIKVLVLLAWLVILFGSLMTWAIRILTAIGRFLFPAVSSISILLCLGLSQLVPRRYTKTLACLIAGLMFAIAAITPFRFIAPAYAKPQPLSAAEIAAIPNRLDVSFGGAMKLLGYDLSIPNTQYPIPINLKPGDFLEVTLYWQSLSQMNQDYSVFVHLLDENELIVTQRDMYPGQGLYPTSLWAVGEAIANRYVLVLPETAFTPNQAQLAVGLYDFATGERLPACGPTGEPLGDNARFLEFEILPRAETGVPNPVHFNFANRIALIGYDLDRRTASPGETIHLTLYWRALAETKEDYVVFAHLLRGQDQIWARADSQPLDGAAPTSTWQPGWIIEDRYELTTELDAPPGIYEIEVGLYLPQAGKRLSILSPDGRLVGDRLLLSKVRVKFKIQSSKSKPMTLNFEL